MIKMKDKREYWKILKTDFFHTFILPLLLDFFTGKKTILAFLGRWRMKSFVFLLKETLNEINFLNFIFSHSHATLKILRIELEGSIFYTILVSTLWNNIINYVTTTIGITYFFTSYTNRNSQNSLGKNFYPSFLLFTMMTTLEITNLNIPILIFSVNIVVCLLKIIIFTWKFLKSSV